MREYYVWFQTLIIADKPTHHTYFKYFQHKKSYDSHNFTIYLWFRGNILEDTLTYNVTRLFNQVWQQVGTYVQNIVASQGVILNNYLITPDVL